MEKKKLAFIEVAAVWFGTHAGGGFATGNQTKNFFVVGGWNSLWMPLVSILIIGLVYRASMIKALETNTYDYRSWSKAMYKPSKVMPVIYEILYLTVAICGISASIAGGASLFESYGLPYVAGILIIGAIFFVLSIFWSEPDQKSLNGYDRCDGSIDDSYLYHWFESPCTGVGIEYSAA